MVSSGGEKAVIVKEAAQVGVVRWCRSVARCSFQLES
jgi:hypothetical protein